MKKGLVFVALMIGLFVMSFVIFGCGTSTSTTTTTTGTVAAAPGATAKAGVLIASGGASIGVAATTVGGSAGNSPAVAGIRSTWLKAFLGNPPPAFFTLDMTTGTASVDGYFNPMSTPPLGGKMTPYIRLNTVGGDTVKGTYFSGKSIANFSTYCSVEAIFAGGPTTKPVGIDDGMHYFITSWENASAGGSNPSGAYVSSTCYTPIKYMGDYLCWAYIYPTIEAKAKALSGQKQLPANANMTTPEAGPNDLIASIDNKMVFSNVVTGEIVINMKCLTDGRTKVGTYSGTGTLITPVATMDVTDSLTFDTAGNPPSLVTIVATNETAPLYTTIVYITNPSTGVGTGEIWDNSASPATLVGTLTSSSTGGTVTVGATTETFTF